MDDTYHIYLNRVARLTLLESYLSGVQHIQSSPKFQPQSDGTRSPVPFPGYSAISPPAAEDPQNYAFYNDLQECQARLLGMLDPGLLVPLPPESFHLTLADLIWDGAYLHAVEENPQFDRKLHQCIGQSFEQCSSLEPEQPIRAQVLGLMLMTRSIGVCLSPKSEESYNPLVQLRRAIYQNQELMALGIEQQYHFTAHITLGYFGEIPPNLDRERLCSILSDFNLHWQDNPQELLIHRVELRKFDEMTNYYREQDWPAFEFGRDS